MLRFDKILVANRGEIARRVLRTLREMGIASVAVYSDADEHAPHVREADEAVRIGPPPSRESYLDMDAVIAAARKTGAQAIHPGYGFLAENAAFAERCEQAGLTFIGPPVDAIRRMGSKIGAKEIMVEAGVPTIPGFKAAGLADDAIAAEAAKLGLPVLIKASAGGGGKGMRIVRDASVFAESLAAARRESASSFGDDTLLIERYFDSPRHVEVQIFGDTHGNVIHCFERECSIQRRFQKVIEEAPSPAVDEDLRRRMGAAAVAAGKAIGYVGAGTVEFLVDGAGKFYFLEVNTRLQVEHPVTEAITGLDLVRMQIHAAQGEPLAVSQSDVRLCGHAFEARLYAEDASRDFLPATGRVALWEPASLPGLRYDSGVETGTGISVHYDPLIAKIIAYGATRDEALDRLISSLRRLAVAGLVTNRAFLLDVLAHPAFRAGQLDTHFIERHLPASARQPQVDTAMLHVHAVVAALYDHEQRRAEGGPMPSSIPSGWRNNRWRPQDAEFHAGETLLRVNYVAREPAGVFDVQVEGATEMQRALVSQYDGAALVVELDGVRRRFRVASDGDRMFVHGPGGTTELTRVARFQLSRAEELAGGCVAPMTGIIRKVNVSVGDEVVEGAVLLVLEAMKMEHQLVTHSCGIVREVRVEVGQMVDPDDVLVIVEGKEI